MEHRQQATGNSSRCLTRHLVHSQAHVNLAPLAHFMDADFVIVVCIYFVATSCVQDYNY